MKIKYKIEILSDWHVGSGLSSGSDADALVIKDENGLPYLPGKTIKGLLRFALEEMKDAEAINQAAINNIFGKETFQISTCYFSNAQLKKEEIDDLIANKELIPFLYRNLSQTKIEKNGIAQNKSLRTTQVCMPVKLFGTIENIVDDNHRQALKNALKWTRHLGVNRNRGLGRCRIASLKLDKND